MKTVVVGCGRWGSFLTWYIDKLGIEVDVYGRKKSKNFIDLKENKKNEFLELSKRVHFFSDITQILRYDLIVVAISAQNLTEFISELNGINLKNKIIVLCMKGIDISTSERLSTLVENGVDESNKVAVWLGPGHPQNFVRGIPNCMVIDSKSEDVKKKLVTLLSSQLIRFYYGNDLIGNEIGAATKNIIGIAAGMLDGVGYGSLKGALMSRGPKEVSRLIVALGGNADTVYGLCHLGDYEATVFSEFSHNRQFGENYIKGIEYNKLAEGYYTVKAIMQLCDKLNIDMPICNGVYEILYKNREPLEVLQELFLRDIKEESV